MTENCTIRVTNKGIIRTSGTLLTLFNGLSLTEPGKIVHTIDQAIRTHLNLGTSSADQGRLSVVGGKDVLSEREITDRFQILMDLAAMLDEEESSVSTRYQREVFLAFFRLSGLENYSTSIIKGVFTIGMRPFPKGAEQLNMLRDILILESVNPIGEQEDPTKINLAKLDVQRSYFLRELILSVLEWCSGEELAALVMTGPAQRRKNPPSLVLLHPDPDSTL